MKKLLLGAILLISSIMFSQETFVRKYTWYAQNIDTTQVDCSVTVVFNYNGTSDVVIYTGTKTIHLVKISDVKEGFTTTKEKFQQIECIDKADGFPITLQLFDKDGVVRLIIEKDYIEYHE